MALEIGGMELAAIFSLPDITHHTAAIALTMDIQQQDGKLGDPRSFQMR
ncbi:hypothetical protein ACPOL_3755 [Acidisarcina polymorpha]|uniref:Uncharacterized protein n=1 Tax=Acidisarcina polymorpha TaxID=2211140 RepID=A0A2Z5G2J5_9BACT|nr:hypothetical protein ACPOL_3755 [Acidisarcina polymorpha]